MNETYSPEPQSIEPQSTPVAPMPPENRDDPGMEESPSLAVPRAYRSGGSLILENDPILPTDMCIKTGRRAYRSFEASIRNPKNPMTWFGKRPTVVLALGRKEFDNYRVAVTLTWAILGVGTLFLLAGLISFSLPMMVVGLLSMAVSGIFRAVSPVTSSDASPESMTLRGVHPTFLKRFEES